MVRVCAIGAALAFGASACADVVELAPERDNTMYEDSGGLSNGRGAYIFTGTTAFFTARRALVRFDIAGNVPPGATINGVTLRMYMSKTISAGEDVALHRVSNDWGEGESDAPGEEGAGTEAAPGDATWTHRFYDTDTWDYEGGDFDASPSASQTVAFEDFYEWTTDALAGDVRAWLDGVAPNYGWIVIGNEADLATAKRFDSGENADPTHWPTLIVDFTAGCKQDCDGDGICDSSESDCDQDGIPNDCEETVCPADLAAPFGVLNIFDFLAFQTLFSDEDVCADLTSPFGVWNVFDFLAFQTAFGNGC